MKVAVVAPWGSARCGLRTYTKFLVEELSKLTEVWVVPHYRYAQPSRQYARWLARRVNRLKPDIVHVMHEYGVWNLWDPGVFLEFLGLVRGRRIVTMHSTGHPVEKEISRLADAVIVHNRYMYEVFQGNKDKALILPHGCRIISIPRDVARRRLGVKPDTYMIGVFGFIDWRKGHDIALEAFSKLKDAEMVFVGGWHSDSVTPYMQQVIMKARELGVRVTGYVDDATFETWLAAVDVVLHPARAVSESGVVSAALGAGKPVVATDHPAFEEKPVARFKTVEELVDILEELRDPGRREEWGRRAREYAERNSWSMVAEKHAELYMSLLT